MSEISRELGTALEGPDESFRKRTGTPQKIFVSTKHRGSVSVNCSPSWNDSGIGVRELIRHLKDEDADNVYLHHLFAE